MSAYYKPVLLSPSDLSFIRESLDENARRHHVAGDDLRAAGCCDTRQRIDGQIREQQTSEERAADLRREIGFLADAPDDDS